MVKIMSTSTSASSGFTEWNPDSQTHADATKSTATMRWDTDTSGEGRRRSQRALPHALTSTFWSAVALGGLVRGAPIDMVRDNTHVFPCEVRTYTETSVRDDFFTVFTVSGVCRVCPPLAPQRRKTRRDGGVLRRTHRCHTSMKGFFSWLMESELPSVEMNARKHVK